MDWVLVDGLGSSRTGFYGLGSSLVDGLGSTDWVLVDWVLRTGF